jgi:hypothetical protein
MNLDGRKDAAELSRSPEISYGGPLPAPIDQDFANAAANLKRTVDAVNAVCCPDLTRKFPEPGLLIPVPRESRC